LWCRHACLPCLATLLRGFVKVRIIALFDESTGYEYVRPRRDLEKYLERGRSSDKLNQWLSSDVGVPEVLLHLGLVVGLMKINTDDKAFEKQLNSVFLEFLLTRTLHAPGE